MLLIDKNSECGSAVKDFFDVIGGISDQRDDVLQRCGCVYFKAMLSIPGRTTDNDLRFFDLK